MQEPTIWLFLLLVLILGMGIGYLLARFRREEVDTTQFVRKEVHEQIAQQREEFKQDLSFSEQELRRVSAAHSGTQKEVEFLQEKLATQQAEVQRLQAEAKLQFEQVANKLLEEKSERFGLQNKQQIEQLLQPLQAKLQAFNLQIQQQQVEDTKQRSALKQEIEQLQLLNAQLSTDANNLVNALKGDNKTQGDWGEYQLELLLEKSGLQKEVHYLAQPSFQDKDGRQKRPDFVIRLPEGKHLILDSKVSLAAYERYFNCEDDDERAAHLRQHIESLKRHIKDLSSKNYQQLYQMNAPDYLLLFVPIEPAFTVANQHQPRLFLDALEQNIVIVTASTLLATMRTVSHIWKQERQKKNVLEIAKQSGLLYDKFVGFVDDLKLIGQRLEDANTAYQSAFNKLKDSPKYGDTLIGRSERIRALGAKASKRLSEDLREEDLLE
ncbi:MAG: DNA recombination protein RmuC [Bacteroidota bacterium]